MLIFDIKENKRITDN